MRTTKQICVRRAGKHEHQSIFWQCIAFKRDVYAQHRPITGLQWVASSLRLAHHSIRPIYRDGRVDRNAPHDDGGVCNVYSIRRRRRGPIATWRRAGARPSDRRRRLWPTDEPLWADVAWRITLDRHRSINDSFCRVCPKSIDFKSDSISRLSCRPIDWTILSPQNSTYVCTVRLNDGSSFIKPLCHLTLFLLRLRWIAYLAKSSTYCKSNSAKGRIADLSPTLRGCQWIPPILTAF